MLELFNPLTRIFTINRMLFVISFALFTIFVDWRSMRVRGLTRESYWVLILNGGLIGLGISASIAIIIFT